ncbi:LPS-assembly lipoprotein [Rhodovulum bhavnagarense]|uniref:LPS-assembly lipoprotein n=1 Tax=Rhodovulum bhavnagarense TaxID=992286 RepID=A0A4V2SWB0_9RHOB|nr:LPS assembly lipoprotein LptE [Rhodovulum bhavnagarense]TCP61616.1 LPS-assembly lipoprotein [Rhodovulum bhavnagarense]
MSSSDRRKFVMSLGALAALGGCGFAPVYGPGGVAEGLQGQIAPDAPKTRAEFALVERLEARLGRAGAARYRLSYRIDMAEDRLGITSQQETTRFNLTGRLAYDLRDLNGDMRTSGEVTAFTAYSATGSTLATLTAERDAQERLMIMLADRLVTRLIATAGTWLQ